MEDESVNGKERIRVVDVLESAGMDAERILASLRYIVGDKDVKES